MHRNSARSPIAAALLLFLGCGTAPTTRPVATPPPLETAVAVVAAPRVPPPSDRPTFADEAREVVWTTAGLYTLAAGAVERVDPADGRALARRKLGANETVDAPAINEGALYVREKKQIRFLHPTTFAPLGTALDEARVEAVPVTADGPPGVEAFMVIPETAGTALRVFHRGVAYALPLAPTEEVTGLQIVDPCASCASIGVLSISGSSGALVELASGRRIATFPFDFGTSYFAPTAKVQGKTLHVVENFGPGDPDSKSQKKAIYRSYSVQTGLLEQAIPLPCATSNDPTPSPDGTRVLVTCDYGDAVLIDRKQRRVQARFSHYVAGCDNGPSLTSYWDPSGKRVHKEGCGGEAIVEMPSGKIACADDPHLAGAPYLLAAASPVSSASSALPAPPALPRCAKEFFSVVAAPRARGAVARVVYEDEAEDPMTQPMKLISSSGEPIPLLALETAFTFDPTGTLLASLEETPAAARTTDGPPRPFLGKLHIRDVATGARRW